jgi:hypothetical protein
MPPSSNWPDIIAAVKTPYGLAALALLVVGVVVFGLFRKGPPWAALIALFMVLVNLVFRVRFVNERLFLAEGSFYVPGKGILLANHNGIFWEGSANPVISGICIHGMVRGTAMRS